MSIMIIFITQCWFTVEPGLMIVSDSKKVKMSCVDMLAEG